MNKEERTEEYARMQLCLAAATDVWILLADEIDEGNTMLAVDKCCKLIQKHFPAPLAKPRRDALGECIVVNINSLGLTTCGLWEFSHDMNHILFDVDFAPPRT